jgi:hypothetical protein
MNVFEAIAGLCRFDFESVLADPAQLGIFLDLALTVSELEPRARDAAERLALAGQEIPGWSLVRREGSRFVESAYVRELLLECPASHLPALLEAIGKTLGNLSEGRWHTLCEAAGRLDADKAVSQSGTTILLRKAGNNKTANH